MTSPPPHESGHKHVTGEAAGGRTGVRDVDPPGACDAITGVEAFYYGYDARERQRWLDLATELGLTPTGGSDCHGDDGPPIGIDLADAHAQRIVDWLAA